MGHEEGFPARGLLYQGSRCPWRNTFKSSQDARKCFFKLSPANTLVHSPSIPSWSSLCFQGKQTDLTGTHLASVNRPRVRHLVWPTMPSKRPRPTSHASGLPGSHHSEQPSCQPRYLCEALMAQPPRLGKGYPEACRTDCPQECGTLRVSAQNSGT